jgi:serine/threonine protein kinase
MYIDLHTSLGQAIQIDDKPLGEGGEGKIFVVTAPSQWLGYVAKIFHPKERTKDKHLKINYLKQNRPQFSDDCSVIWAEELLFENRQFVGYLMREVPNGIDLTYLCNLTISEKLPTFWHEKYNREHYQGLLNRLQVCFNLAKAIAQIHQSKQYVLVDLKPENIKIRPTGEVSLLDLDSIEVIDNQQLIFPPQKLSPEYSPPEIKALKIQIDLIPETWDRFSLAVVFYKILFGLHPFSVTGKESWQELSSHEQKIQAGLFAHGVKKSELAVIPQPHTNFKVLSKELQVFFQRALGENPLHRPSAEDWAKQLIKPKIEKKNYINPLKQPIPTKPKLSKTKLPPTKKAAKMWAVSRAVFALSIVITPIWFMPKPSNTSLTKMPTTKPVQQMNPKLMADIWQKRLLELRAKFVEVKELYPKIARVKVKNKYGLIGESDNYIALPEYDLIDTLGGYLVYELDKKYGVLNSNGNLLITNQYEAILDYKENLFLVRQDDKFGYINTEGKIIIPLIFDKATPFHNGTTWLEKDNERFAIDSKGQIVATSLSEDAIRKFLENYYQKN